MPVTERHEDPGQFTITLDAGKVPWHDIRELGEMGHIVLTPQHHLHPDMFAESDFLTAARYTGVVLQIEWEEDTIVLRGQGNVWHLGDAFQNGPILAADVTFAADTPATVLALATGGGLLPPALTVGTITGTGVSAYTGTFYASQTILECIRTYMAAVNMTFRINPNWSFDACLATRDEVFKTTESAITVVATPKGFGGDPTYTGIEPETARTKVDASRWVSRSVVEQTDAAGARSILSSSNRSPIPYQDPQGNELVRNVIQAGPSSDDVGFTDFHARTLAEWNTISEQELTTQHYEFSGPFEVGDFIYVYDPVAGFYDETVGPIPFRGQFIHPKIIQVVEDDWGVYEGMGVYFKPSGVDYRQAVMTDNPLGYWRLDEPSGTTAADQTTNYDLTYVNTPTLSAAGVMRDGSGNTGIDITADEGADGSDWAAFEFDGVKTFTVEAWVTLDTATSAGDAWTAVQKQTADSGSGWELGAYESGGQTGFYFNRVSAGGASTEGVGWLGVIVGALYHLVATYDGTTLALWVNGQLVKTNGAALSMGTSSVALSIGHDTETADAYWRGKVDEVAIWNTALADSRIAEHYRIGSRGNGKTGNWVDLTRAVRFPS